MNKIVKKFKIDFDNVNSIDTVKRILAALDLTFTLGDSSKNQPLVELYRLGLLKEVNE